jgi:predicted transport protein
VPKSPEEMASAITDNLPKKTGKTLKRWVQLLKTNGPAESKARVDWLKREHKLGHVTACLIAREADGRSMSKVYSDPDALVRRFFAGPRAQLRPIYEAVIKMAKKLGKDVDVSPRKTYIVINRNRKFAAILPTETSVDLDLVLPGMKDSGRLKSVRNSACGERMTHRVRISALSEVDKELEKWLRGAYVRDGE